MAAKKTEAERPAEPARAFTFRDFRPQGEAVASLERSLRDGTYVHAYLISGMAGVGKRSLARLIASTLLCTGGGEGGGLL